MTAADPLERRLRLEGARNFRDLGGYETRDGHRVRWRTLFRSDALTRLTEEDADALRSMGIRRVFDLRTRTELERAGPSAHLRREAVETDGSGASAIEHRHVPFFEELGGTRREAPAEGDPRPRMVASYSRMLERAGPSVSHVVAALAEEQPRAVFHCTAGKDRTGLLAALILRALGVHDDTIVEDYALTRVYSPPQSEQRRRELSEQFGIEITPEVMDAAPETMSQTLVEIDARYGSTEALLREYGVTSAQLDGLREHLLGG